MANVVGYLRLLVAPHTKNKINAQVIDMATGSLYLDLYYDLETPIGELMQDIVNIASNKGDYLTIVLQGKYP